MINKFTIRSATLADLEVLVMFRVAILRELNILKDDAETEFMKPKFRNYIKNKIASKELFCWLAESNGKIVGAGKAVIYDAPPQSRSCDGKEGYIFGIYTVPEMRGQGLGNLMMKHIITELKEKGYNYIWLRASKIGKPIYEKLGFVPSGKDSCEYMELNEIKM